MDEIPPTYVCPKCGNHVMSSDAKRPCPKCDAPRSITKEALGPTDPSADIPDGMKQAENGDYEIVDLDALQKWAQESGIAQKTVEHEKSVQDALTSFRAYGIDARLTCPACPVQFEGTIGKWFFFFRERHGECTVEFWDDRISLPEPGENWTPKHIYNHDGEIQIPSWCSYAEVSFIMGNAMGDLCKTYPGALNGVKALK